MDWWLSWVEPNAYPILGVWFVGWLLLVLYYERKARLPFKRCDDCRFCGGKADDRHCLAPDAEQVIAVHLQRRYGPLKSRVAGTCGAAGRWWRAK